MKRILSSSLICLSFLLAVSSTPAREPKTEKKKTALRDELISKEKSVWNAYKRKDAKAIEALLASDFYAVEDADGEIMSKDDAIRSVAGLDLKTYEMEDLVVLEVNEDCAIVRYRVKTEGTADRHEFVPHWSIVSSIWVKRSGKWQNFMYQETKIGE